jgi:uncharacterized protein YjbJ (UPF0337 family)
MQMADHRDEMNRESLENQGKGLVNELEGKGRNAVGGLKGDVSEQLKGKGEELEGKAQKEIGKAEAPRTNER